MLLFTFSYDSYSICSERILVLLITRLDVSMSENHFLGACVLGLSSINSNEEYEDTERKKRNTRKQEKIGKTNESRKNISGST
jgi:hypothetical protein